MIRVGAVMQCNLPGYWRVREIRYYYNKGRHYSSDGRTFFCVSTGGFSHLGSHTFDSQLGYVCDYFLDSDGSVPSLERKRLLDGTVIESDFILRKGVKGGVIDVRILNRIDFVLFLLVCSLVLLAFKL